jgi:hypothetical protein
MHQTGAWRVASIIDLEATPEAVAEWTPRVGFERSASGKRAEEVRISRPQKQMSDQ